MASIRDIRKRIRSVQSTKKITKAMKMVAAAKLRRAQEAAEQSKPYAKSITKLMDDLVAQGVGSSHGLLQPRKVAKRLLVVFSSDRGLCGAFNSGLFRLIEKNLVEAGVETELLLIGRKAQSYFSRRKVKIWKNAESFWDQFSHPSTMKWAKELTDLFLTQAFDQIDFAYNEFVSVMTQKPLIETFLPLSRASADNPKGEIHDSLSVPPKFEPGKETILNALVPKVIGIKCYQPCLQSQASEFGARMAAMDSATRNAGDMIDQLTLTMNRVRQANITRELVEIISGAEAIN